MNLIEKVNHGRNKTGLNKNRPHQFVHKPFMGVRTKQICHKKDSTPSSKLNWGRSRQSITSSFGVNTETSSKEDARIIIALSEGRGEARCEVGIAVINVSQPHLILCQISDTQSYDNTLRKINIFNPNQILMPMTFIESATQSRLIEKVKEQFPHVNCTAVKRNTYNKASGMEYVQELCIPSLNSVLLVLQHRYYALTAASALLRFLHNNLNIFYASGSIKIDYQESEGYAIIDISTADRLELVSSTRPFQASKYSTLFGVLNNCYTRIGERALRTILLQPPYATAIILERQDAVTALVNRPEKLQAIQVMLQKIGNIDQLLTLPTIVVDDSQYWSERQLNYMLYLNGLADIIITLSEMVLDLKEAVFVNFCNTLNSQDFLTIRDTVRTLIHENAYSAKSHNGLTQRCFAIKAGINGLLDLVRKIYSERLDDMRDYVKVLGEKYDLSLTLGNNISKGYHIILSLNKHQKMSMKKSDLPREFIQVCRLAGSFKMKTMEIINFQTRIDDIVADIMKISNVMIFKTLSSFKKYMGLFHELCEHISNIDVIQSLAEVSIRNNYTKPTFGEYTEVTDSLHPMLEMLAHERPVPNLISSSKDYNIHIITGPNGSGKSIFIRQVMLLQIVAQIGGYVPASSAVFRPADRLFARVYLEDNMECGASSFVLEIKEVSYILSHITNNSLIIMDELGRSTSLEEGSALAMTVCERLADSSAFVYLTSHFTLITKLGDMYLNIKNWHMDTEAAGNTPRNLKLDFKYNLKRGVTNLKNYGIFMVKTLWPRDILEDVYAMLEQTSRPNQEPHIQKISTAIRRKYQLESNLRKLKAEGNLKLFEVYKLVNQYRCELENQNIYLENINFIEDKFSKHYANNYLDDGVSDEVSSEADDIITYPDNTPQNNYQTGDDTKDSECSSYKQLSRFIGEDTANLNFLNPEIIISYPDGEHNQTIEEEFNPKNQNFIDAAGNVNKTSKINILSNIVINKYTLDNIGNIDEEVNNLPYSTVDYFQMKNYEDFIYSSQEALKSSQGSHEINNSINRSLLMQKSNLTEHLSDYNQNYEWKNTMVGNSFRCEFPDYENNMQNFHFQNQNKESQILNSSGDLFNFKKLAISEDGRKEHLDFQFQKPMSRTFKRRTQCSEKFEKVDNVSNIDQFHFSLPLLRNQDKTSTPIVSGKRSIGEDSFTGTTNSPSTSFCGNVKKKFNFNKKAKVIDEIRKDETKPQHLFPEIIIMEGTNDHSLSFGEEDGKPEGPPFSTVHEINEVDQLNKENIVDMEYDNFEESIKKEVKVFLRHSTDLFEGDVDSLEVTLQNYHKSEPTDAFNDNTPNESLHINKENSFKRCTTTENNKSDFFNDDTTIENEFQNSSCNVQVNSVNDEVRFDGNISSSAKLVDNKDFTNDMSLVNYPKIPNLKDGTIEIRNMENEEFENIRYESKYSDSKQSNHIFDNDYGKSEQYSNVGCFMDDSKSSDNKEKVTTTSISEASRQRNLDISSSGKSSDSKHQSKSSHIKVTTTTDISGASRERNLDNMSSNSTENENSSRTEFNQNSPSIKSTEIKQKFPIVSERNEDISESKLIVNEKDLVVSQYKARYFCTSLSSPSEYFETADEMNLTAISEKRNLDNSSSTNENRNFHASEKMISNKDLSKKDVENISVNINTLSGENHDFNKSSEAEKSEQYLDSEENSNYKSANEDVSEDNFKIIRNKSATKTVKKMLGYTRRPCNSSTTSKKNKADSNDKVIAKRRKSIVGPFKLTKNEIQEEFDKQDQILLQEDMDISTYSKYLNQRINRPSVRQIQNAKHIATIRKTDNGTLVLPAEKSPRKIVKNTVIAETTNCFDMSIFSDQNASKMSAFLASSDRNYSTFKFDATKEMWPVKSTRGFCSQVTRKKKFERTRSLWDFKFRDFPKITLNHNICSPFLRQSQESEGSSIFIPDGYFKAHQRDIENICAKYLTRSDSLMYKAKTSPL